MIPDAQHAAIAKACGWTLRWQSIAGAELLDSKPEFGWEVWTHPDAPVFEEQYPPNYLECLNDMHEAEKVLKGRETFDYFSQLSHICNSPRDICFVTASQRAEAFLKTLNLWTS